MSLMNLLAGKKDHEHWEILVNDINTIGMTWITNVKQKKGMIYAGRKFKGKERVRNKKETHYCYSDEEKQIAMEKVGKNPEITRFKGLGEISPNEFKYFIGKDIRLEPVILGKENKIQEILTFFMGKNTPDRQKFIIENLRVEEEIEL